jgi:hypothetical protein
MRKEISSRQENLSALNKRRTKRLIFHCGIMDRSQLTNLSLAARGQSECTREKREYNSFHNPKPH